jgi:hypothetical protein
VWCAAHKSAVFVVLRWHGCLQFGSTARDKTSFMAVTSKTAEVSYLDTAKVSSMAEAPKYSFSKSPRYVSLLCSGAHRVQISAPYGCYRCGVTDLFA